MQVIVRQETLFDKLIRYSKEMRDNGKALDKIIREQKLQFKKTEEETLIQLAKEGLAIEF